MVSACERYEGTFAVAAAGFPRPAVEGNYRKETVWQQFARTAGGLASGDILILSHSVRWGQDERPADSQTAGSQSQ